MQMIGIFRAVASLSDIMQEKDETWEHKKKSYQL